MLPVPWVLYLWMIFMMLVVITLFNMKIFSFLDDGLYVRKNYLGEVRFLLSAAVFFHHLILCGIYFDGLGWGSASYKISAYSGKMAVAMFFMISGFLFGAINKKNVSFWFGFYTKRIFRLGPMYFVSSFLCLGLAFILGDMIYSWGNTVLRSAFWFDLGIFNIRPKVNTLEQAPLINAGATWTLRWEWYLYFSLPILIVINDKLKKIILPLVCGFAMSHILYACYFGGEYMAEYPLVIYSICFGMLCRNIALFDNLKWRLILLMVVVGVFDFFILKKPSLLSVSVVFVAASQKNFLLRFLENTGLRRLSNISYSLFHLHGIVWFVMFLLNGEYFKKAPTFGWLIIATGFFFMLIIFATGFYYFVEKRAYAYGKSLASKV